jgi:uncharacterized protein YqeY
MTLEQQIAADLSAAVKAGDEERKRTLRMLRAALQNAAIEARSDLDDAAVVAVVQRQAKQRRDAAGEYERGGRSDLAAAELSELTILEAYLPRQLDDSEIEAAARRRIEAAGATGPSDIGRVMGPLMADLAGRADGARVSAIVRRLLSG